MNTELCWIAAFIPFFFVICPVNCFKPANTRRAVKIGRCSQLWTAVSLNEKTLLGAFLKNRQCYAVSRLQRFFVFQEASWDSCCEDSADVLELTLYILLKWQTSHRLMVRANLFHAGWGCQWQRQSLPLLLHLPSTWLEDLICRTVCFDTKAGCHSKWYYTILIFMWWFQYQFQSNAFLILHLKWNK